jgi:endogenous inhibitor of DNA gyrase (YacG/DUF329 family)
MTCPICGKPGALAHRPFCSRRCADVDLGRWLTGSYVIPTDEAEDDEAERHDTTTEE